MEDEVTLLDRPSESLAGVVLWGTVMFYWAEKDENERVKDVWDAFYYVTTSLSVGYANLHPVTPMGKMIGGLVMSIGPALAAHALDPPLEGAPAAQTLGDKLDAILVELKKIASVSAS